jgi:murein DD-endopeptidase MepM/ murein hydrolase activator NlpD
MRLAILVCALQFAASAAALEIRAWPGARIYAVPLDASRGLNGALAQNVALVNDGTGPLTLDSVEFAIMRGTDATDVRALAAADLDRIAKRTAPLDATGMIAALPFHFGGTKLLPAGTRLSDGRTLEPGEALLVPHQFFAFAGARDALRVRATAGTATTERLIPLSMTGAETSLALPLDGTWYDGAAASPHTHHRWVSAEEFAHDFVRLGADGRSFIGEGTRFTDFLAHGAPVRAAAAGRVVRVVAGVAEDEGVLQQPGETSDAYTQRLMAGQDARLAAGSDAITGNLVVIDLGRGEFAMYAHLRPGSVRVRVGEQVAQGQVIAEVGSSGNSTEPHLHFQICDGPDPMACAAIPATFANVEVWGAIPQRQPQSGDFVRSVRR